MTVNEKLSFRAMLETIEQKNRAIPSESVSSTSPESFPEICTTDCPHHQCSSWGTVEMQGKPCRNRVPKNPPSTLPQITRGIEEQIEEAVKRAFKPIDEKITKLEREAFEHRVENQELDGEEHEKLLRIIRRAEGLNAVGSD